MSSEVLKEFLVKLGFQVDETGNKKLDDQLKRTTKNVKFIGEAIGAVVTAATGMTLLFASSMEKMYYASRRSGATVANLQALEYAGRQIGLSAGTTTQAVEGLANSLRANPALVGMLHGTFGIQTKGRDSTQILLDLVGKLRQMPFFQAQQFGQMFGLDPHTLLMMEQSYGKLRQYEAQRLKMNQQAGINPNEQAKQAHQLMVEFRQLTTEWGVLKAQMANDFMPVANQVLHWADALVLALIKLDKRTQGWSNRIGFVVGVLASWKASMMAVEKLGGMMLPGAAAGAEEKGAAGGVGGALLRGGGGLVAAVSKMAASLALVAADVAAINQAYQAITTGHSGISTWLNHQIGGMLGIKGFTLGGQIYDTQQSLQGWWGGMQKKYPNWLGGGGASGWHHQQLGGGTPVLGLSAPTGGAISLHQTTQINVHGGGDPHSTAHAVAGEQMRVNSDLVRNMKGGMR